MDVKRVAAMSAGNPAMAATQGATNSSTAAASSAPPTAPPTGTPTGTTTGLLSPDTAGQAIQAGQQAASTDNADSAAGLPIATQHYMQDIANDPAFAQQQVDDFANLMTLCAVNLHVPPGGGPMDPALNQQVLQKCQTQQAAAQSLQRQLQGVAAQDKAQGKSAAETYADMLKVQLSQPQSYWDAIDPDHTAGDYKGQVQAKLAALRQYMAAPKADPTSAAAQPGQTGNG